MMPVYQSFGPGITGAGNPISLDYMPNSWITCTMQPIGAVSGLVQVTLDSIFDQDDPNYQAVNVASWFPVNTAPLTPMAAQTAAFYLNFPGPFRAIRWFSTANATGVIFAVAQSVSPRA